MSDTRNRLHILLLRHGLTDANAGGVIQGHRPVPLNELGHRQARLLAERLAQRSPKIDRLVSSDLPRAAQTAAPIASACGLSIVLDQAWRERCFGEFEGKTAAEQDIWRAAAGEIDPPGAESATTFAARIHAALTGLAQEHTGPATIAVVTHGGPCRTVLRMLADGRLKLSPEAPKPELTTIANCSIMHLSCLRHGRELQWRLERLNDVQHLAELGTTLRDAG